LGRGGEVAKKKMNSGGREVKEGSQKARMVFWKQETRSDSSAAKKKKQCYKERGKVDKRKIPEGRRKKKMKKKGVCREKANLPIEIRCVRGLKALRGKTRLWGEIASTGDLKNLQGSRRTQ